VISEEERKHKLNFVKEKLKERECKFTPQRKATFDVLMENPSKHLSTEDIYDLVKEKYPDIGLATIYRTLQLFDDLNIIKKLNFNDGCYRYELSENQRHQHHHLICIQCGTVYEFDDDLLEDLEHKISINKNFTVTDHMVKLFGYCRLCKDKDKD